MTLPLPSSALSRGVREGTRMNSRGEGLITVGREMSVSMRSPAGHPVFPIYFKSARIKREGAMRISATPLRRSRDRVS
jgi:hypothetical protein